MLFTVKIDHRGKLPIFNGIHDEIITHIHVNIGSSSRKTLNTRKIYLEVVLPCWYA